MPNIRTLARSFNGGEVTPEFYGQLQDPKFQTGLALARNFEILPHGPAQNRAGFGFVRETKHSGSKKARVISYAYSTTQTFAIEIGEGYFRFHTNGATLLVSGAASYNGATAYTPGDVVVQSGVNYYCILDTTGNAPPNATYWYAMPSGDIFEVPNSYLEADIMDIHYVQSQDILTLVHPNYRPSELQRRGAIYWTFIQEDFTSDLEPPTGVEARSSVVTGSNRSAQAYKVAAVGVTGIEESLPSSNTNTSVNISNVTKANPGFITTSTPHGFTVNQVVRIANVGGMVELAGWYKIYTAPTSTMLSLEDPAGNGLDTTGYSTYTSGGTITLAPEVAINNLLTTGNYNTIIWNAVTDATRYNVYKQSNGLYGFIGQTDELTFRDDNLTPDISKTPPIQSDPFDSVDNYPGAVSYFEQRKAYAGTIEKPQNLWLTQSGSEYNLGYGIPALDTDAISFRIAAREANTIRHIVPLSQLILLTSSVEYRVTSVNSDALTPTTISVRPQSYIGASNVQPVIVNNNLLYAAARGGHVRELGYSWQQQAFTSGDLSLRAPHLFDGYTILDMAFAKAPQPIAWMPSSNGNLLGITYVPEQSIGAWHHHDSYTRASKSIIESVCVVAEGSEDVLYCVIKRVINGNIVRYIERKHSRLFTEIQDQFFVDSGVSYDNPITITGITSADPVVVTATAHGFSNGDPVDIMQVVGMDTVEQDGGTTSFINGIRFYASAVTANTLALQDEDGNDIDGSSWPAYLSGGVIRKAISTISAGLSHLEGETVSVLADGVVAPQQVVTGGGLPDALEAPASRIHIGLPITSDLQLLPMTFDTLGAGQGRQKNVNKVWLRVNASSGIFAGPSFNKLTEAKQRTTEPYGSPPNLKSEEVAIVLSPSWQDNGQVCVRQSDPLAITLVSVEYEVAIGS